MKNEIMEIGILTFHNTTNSGGVLQTYALYKFLTDNNFKVKIINYENHELKKNNAIFVNPIHRYLESRKLNNSRVKSLKYSLRGVLSNLFVFRKLKVKRKFSKFRLYNLNLKGKTIRKTELNKYYSSLDAIILGSDQIWNPSITGNTLDSTYFGNCFIDKLLISYAASAGGEMPERYIVDFKNYLEQIQYISVREKVLANQIYNVTGRNVEVVIDPTLLLEKSQWENKVSSSFKHSNYIMVYTLEDNQHFFEIANYVASKLNLKIIELGYKRKISINSDLCKSYDPFEFIELVKNADYVITNSFHATVFSIIFEKQFITVPHTTRGSRMIELLNSLGLQNNLIDTIENAVSFNLQNKINYIDVNKKLSYMRDTSKSYILNTLNNYE